MIFISEKMITEVSELIDIEILFSTGINIIHKYFFYFLGSNG